MSVPIDKLASTDTLVGGDLLAVWKTTNGDTRKASLTLLASWLSGQITVGQLTTQYNTPTATGFNVQVTDNSQSTHLILTPLAGYAAGTITLPSSDLVVDKQEVLVNSTQAVTTLTVAGNGSTVLGAPATLAANGFFRLKYDAVNQTWYRIG